MKDTPEPLGMPAEIDLAHEKAFALGRLQVTPSTREISSRRGRFVIEPRVMQALVYLARSAGTVVSRDDLIKSCWAGRIVGEDAINRCIAKVRDLAQAEDVPPFEIETIPRVGYRLKAASTVRLVAPDEQPIEPEPPLGPVAVPVATASRRGRLAIGVITGAFAAVLAGTIWFLWPGQKWSVENSRPFISSSDQETYPAFSPDGSMVAYAASAGNAPNRLFVRNIAGGDPIELNTGRFDATSPTWSSDGVHVAYLASGDTQQCAIMVTTVPAGEWREIGHCNANSGQILSWQPNSNFVYFSDQQPDLASGSSIYKINVDTGAIARVTHPPGDWGFGGDGEAHISPNGQWLAYRRGVSGARSELRLRNLADGQERILDVDSQLAAIAWTNDSKSVLAAVTDWVGTEIQAFPLDGARSYVVYASSANLEEIAVNAAGLLATQVDASRYGLARASPTPRGVPDIIDSAYGLTVSPTFAPDGTLAFVSNRSGHYAIWTMKPGAKPVQLFAQPSGYLEIQGLTWSPDGQYLAFITYTNDAIVARVMTSSGAIVSTFETSSVGPGFPSWTPDSQGLVLFEKSSRRAWRIDIQNPTHRTPVAERDWVAVAVRETAIFATRIDKPGIWQIDPEIRLISAEYPRSFNAPIAFMNGNILMPDFNAPDGARILSQPIGGGPATVFAYAPAMSDISNFTVNAKTGEIVYVAGVTQDRNIDLLQLAKH
jgi:Tol biopolymer transport system component/DNA-binding winged helix-turn-helix (wHTH) protein